MDVPKRKLDEAQAETDETARVQVFRDHVALLEKLRVQVHSHGRKSRAQRDRLRKNGVNISAVNSQVFELLDHIAALMADIPHPLLLTPPVPDCQWQATRTELDRQCCTRNLKGTSGAPKSEIGARLALHQLSSEPLHKERATKRGGRWSAHKSLQRRQRNHAQLYDAAWNPGAESSDSLAKAAEWRRFNEVAEGVVERTTFLESTEQMLGLLAADLVSELHDSNSFMKEYYQVQLDGGAMAIQNTGGNPGFEAGAEWLEVAMLPRLLAAVSFMVIHSLCVCDDTLL